MSRRLLGEAIGTAALLYAIVAAAVATAGLGAAAPVTAAVAVGAALATMIALFSPVSGSHFNPAVTLAFWRTGSIAGLAAVRYVLAQVAGAVIGVILAHLSFRQAWLGIAARDRSGSGILLAEGVATALLVLLIVALVRQGRPALVPPVVGAWVIAMALAASSTGFANPAVTVARTLTDTAAGIAPSSAVAFLAVQFTAGLVAAETARFLHPVEEAP